MPLILLRCVANAKQRNPPAVTPTLPILSLLIGTLLSGGVGELGPHEQEGFGEESPEQPISLLANSSQ